MGGEVELLRVWDGLYCVVSCSDDIEAMELLNKQIAATAKVGYRASDLAVP